MAAETLTATGLGGSLPAKSPPRPTSTFLSHWCAAWLRLSATTTRCMVSTPTPHRAVISTINSAVRRHRHGRGHRRRRRPGNDVRLRHEGNAGTDARAHLAGPQAICRPASREVRKNGKLPYLRPDGKSQVTVEYGEDGQPARIDAVVISSQHSESVSNEELHADVLKHVIQAVLPAAWLDEHTKYHINPTGRFVIGGPMGDTGLTGRKIIVDTYGGMGRHGGGAFSGKDPTKVDRSAAYMARHIAKNIVAAGLADKAEVQLAYAIGVAEPVSVLIDTFGTGKVSESKLTELVRKNFSLNPKGIIESLEPAPAHLPEDRGVRPLWLHRSPSSPREGN